MQYSRAQIWKAVYSKLGVKESIAVNKYQCSRYTINTLQAGGSNWLSLQAVNINFKYSYMHMKGVT